LANLGVMLNLVFEELVLGRQAKSELDSGGVEKLRIGAFTLAWSEGHNV